MVKDYKSYLDRGKNITPLKGKLPILKNWQERELSGVSLEKYDGNYGWVLGVDDLVIDVDPRNGGDVSFKKLQTVIKEFSFTTSVNTPQGYHIYLRNGNLININKKLRGYEGIDFLSKGAQCVIPGSIVSGNRYRWYDVDFPYPDQPQAPDKLIEMLSSGSSSRAVNVLDLEDFTGKIDNAPGWDAARVKKSLSFISPDCDYHTWIKIGMALHHSDIKGAFDEWEEWSKPGKTYKSHETAKMWNSFRVNKDNPVTISTLVHLSESYRKQEQAQAVEYFTDKIINSSQEDLLGKVFPAIKSKRLDMVELAILEKVAQDRLKIISGVKPPIKSIRDALTPRRSGLLESPDWVKSWTYVNDRCGWLKDRNRTVYKKEAFNLINADKIPPSSNNGATLSANIFVQGFCKVVTTAQYMPNSDKLYVEGVRGEPALNTFDAKSVPKESEQISDDGSIAIEFIKRHVSFLCSGKPEDADIFINWLAHQVQSPGKLLKWAPVIYSIPGVGKGFIGDMLIAILGRENVSKVEATQAVSKYTGWACGSSTIILNELRISGENRHMIIDRIKPLITDSVIQVEEKFIAATQALNTANYLCLTNHLDPIPIDSTDRRWWFVNCNIKNITEIENLSSMGCHTYYHRLFECLNHADDIRKWLLDHSIPKSFRELTRAPMNEAREMVIMTEESKIEGLFELKELIEEGSTLYDENLICSASLFTMLDFKHPGISLRPRDKKYLLTRLGYSCLGRIKIEGITRLIWAKKMFSTSEVREHFKDKNR